MNHVNYLRNRLPTKTAAKQPGKFYATNLPGNAFLKNEQKTAE